VALIALVTLSAAAVLPAAHAAASTPTAPGQAANFVQRVVDLTNQERARQGLPPLVLDSALSGSALAHNEDMADQGFFSHTGSSGSSVDQRIAAAGFHPLWAYGENIAAGQLTPEEVVEAWMNSEGHRANILSPGYSHIGAAYTYAPGTTYVHYWTQDFASHSEVHAQRLPVAPPEPTCVPPTPTPAPPAAAAPRPARTTPLAPAVALKRIWQVVRSVNRARAENGLPALALDPALCVAAELHSIEMARHGFFAHAPVGGSPPGAEVTENIAAGQTTAEEVVGDWLANPTLRGHILDPGLSRIGVGYAYGAESAYGHYWTLHMAGDGAASLAQVAPAVAWQIEGLGRSLVGWLKLLAGASVA